MPLTDVEVRKAKPGPKILKLSDGGGLQLWVTPDGAKRWRFAYRFIGKQKVLAVGVYPEVSLSAAREAREAARKLLADGTDPSAAKKVAKAQQATAHTNTFDTIAAELIEKKRREGKAAQTIVKFEWFMSLARPALGQRPISEITAPDVLAVLRPIETRGNVETAKKTRGAIGQVFRFAIATGRAENDPTGALKGALATPVVTHRAAIVEAAAFGALLRAIDGYQGTPETKAALELLALTFVRPGELRAAEWEEFDLDAAQWIIPAGKMKMRRPHRVPLAPRAVAILRDLHAITAGGRFVFPSIRTGARCMSENTINAALRRLGFTSEEMTGHGFRATASSVLNESGLWHADAIERQLAHVDNDNVRRAYHRADYWDERVRMMHWWADACDSMRSKPRNERQEEFIYIPVDSGEKLGD
jgi:integrase